MANMGQIKTATIRTLSQLEANAYVTHQIKQPMKRRLAAAKNRHEKIKREQDLTEFDWTCVLFSRASDAFVSLFPFVALYGAMYVPGIPPHTPTHIHTSTPTRWRPLICSLKYDIVFDKQFKSNETKSISAANVFIHLRAKHRNEWANEFLARWTAMFRSPCMCMLSVWHFLSPFYFSSFPSRVFLSLSLSGNVERPTFPYHFLFDCWLDVDFACRVQCGVNRYRAAFASIGCSVEKERKVTFTYLRTSYYNCQTAVCEVAHTISVKCDMNLFERHPLKSII